MSYWTPLWSQIVSSSLWQEPYFVRVLFTSMLALKDEDMVVRYDSFHLHTKANMPESDVLAGLKILSEPDRFRTIKQEFEGRRIQKVEDGWLILNGGKYRELVRQEMTRQRNARSQRAFRNRQRLKSLPSGAESSYERILEDQGKEAADAWLAGRHDVDQQERADRNLERIDREARAEAARHGSGGKTSNGMPVVAGL